MSDEILENVYRPPHYQFNVWLKEQIYTGPENNFGQGQGGVVPNVNDEVIEWVDNVRHSSRVAAVDSKGLSTLVPTEAPVSLGGQPVAGVNVGVHELDSLANLYLNNSDNKFPVSVDVRLPMAAADVAYGKLYIGNDLGSRGEVISVRYDGDGNVIDDRINVVRSNPSDPDNLYLTVREGNIDRNLPEDTRVLLVFYNATNGMVAYRSLLVKHNALVANLNNNVMFIKDIEIISPWVNPSNPSELLVPKSMLESTFNPRVNKVYQSNQRAIVPWSDADLTQVGWGDQLLGEIGERIEMVLKYRLKPEERSTILDPTLGQHIAKTYTIITVGDGLERDYVLYMVPRWEDDVTGYKLWFYLYDSYYDTCIECTNAVVATTLQGLDYNDKQLINYSLDLSLVNGLTETGTISGADVVQLIGKPLTKDTAYRIYDFDTDTRPYGENLKMVLSPTLGNYSLNLAPNHSSKDQWLEDMYYRLKPPFESLNVDKAPEPTHVDVLIGDVLTTFEIANWNAGRPWTAPVPINGDMGLLKFYILDASNKRKELAITALPVEVV